jgi:hypothetical protein
MGNQEWSLCVLWPMARYTLGLVTFSGARENGSCLNYNIANCTVPLGNSVTFRVKRNCRIVTKDADSRTFYIVHYKTLYTERWAAGFDTVQLITYLTKLHGVKWHVVLIFAWSKVDSLMKHKTYAKFAVLYGYNFHELRNVNEKSWIWCVVDRAS